MPGSAIPSSPVPGARPAAPDRLVCRPRKLVLASVVGASVLALGSLIGWFALPVRLRAQFEFSQVVTLLILLGLLVVGVAIMASSNVRADEHGVRIRNGLGVHRLGWDAVHKFILRPGDPWGIVLVRPQDRDFEVDLDAEKFQLMGIQAGDGAAAVEQIALLRAMQRRFATAPAMPQRPRPAGPPRQD